MKVIDIISKTFEAHKEVDLKASHDRQDKIDKFDITMRLVKGGEIHYRVFMQKHELDIILDKKYFESMKFKKWISVFEYELEQTMLMNIRLSVSEDPTDYTVKIIF